MRLLWIVPVAASLLAAQDAVPPTFDVLSLKHVGDAASISTSISTSEGNATYSNQQPVRFVGGSMSCKTTLRGILQAAYALKDYQIQGPDWIDREVYEIGARMPDRTPVSTARGMLQSALADRMGLKVRLEKKSFRSFCWSESPAVRNWKRSRPIRRLLATRWGRTRWKRFRVCL
jgi:hypothetical protein